MCVHVQDCHIRSLCPYKETATVTTKLIMPWIDSKRLEQIWADLLSRLDLAVSRLRLDW